MIISNLNIRYTDHSSGSLLYGSTKSQPNEPRRPRVNCNHLVVGATFEKDDKSGEGTITYTIAPDTFAGHSIYALYGNTAAITQATRNALKHKYQAQLDNYPEHSSLLNVDWSGSTLRDLNILHERVDRLVPEKMPGELQELRKTTHKKTSSGLSQAQEAFESQHRQLRAIERQLRAIEQKAYATELPFSKKDSAPASSVSKQQALGSPNPKKVSFALPPQREETREGIAAAIEQWQKIRENATTAAEHFRPLGENGDKLARTLFNEWKFRVKGCTDVLRKLEHRLTAFI